MPDPNSQLEDHSMRPEKSPPSSPSSPDPAETDTKLSRKREREVSLEPATTPKAATETDSHSRENKETRTPAKKNRIYLDPTEEEEDVATRSRSNSGSPPQSASPPQEIKMRVRQISQGVEDISWRNMKATTPEGYIEEDVSEALHATKSEENGAAEPDATASHITVTEGETPEKKTRSQLSDGLTPAKEENPEALANSVDLPPTASDSDSPDKGLKRKFLDRGNSQGPADPNDTFTLTTEPLKRPRDDADKDDNPRVTKRPSPPPESRSPKKAPPPTASPKLAGFMAYASTSSPFASVKGQNIFSSNKPPPSSPPFPHKHTPAVSIPAFSRTSAGEPSNHTSGSSTKRSGFEAFASSTSPFSSVVRSKSPVLGSTSKLGRNKSPPRRANSANVNAFSSYAGSVQSFAIPVQKRARAGSPTNSSRSSLERNSTLNVFGSNGGLDSGAEDDDRAVSFGEKLRAGKDDDDEGKSDDEQAKLMLTEQDLMTGEEEEDTIHQVRGKLFSLSDGNQWKERGTGTLKLNVRRSDGSGARLVMRKEAVYTLLLNVTLFNGMRCTLAQDPRYLRFSVIEDGITTHYNLRLASAKIAQELLEEVNANIPVM